MGPDGDKVRTLTDMSDPTNVKRFRSPRGGLVYCLRHKGALAECPLASGEGIYF